MQRRWAAKELAISPGSPLDRPSSEEPSNHNQQLRKFPVLEPSMFFLDEFDANEWIKVFRRHRKNMT
jgi:hypothetical protein